MDTDDLSLILASRSGDEKAFDGLISRYIRPVYAFVLSMTHDVPMAEDIVQDTCVKAWKHLESFDNSKSFKTWIFAIAKNTAYDALKKKKALPFSAFAEDDEDEGHESWADRIADQGPLPDELLMREDAAHLLGEKLSGLPEDFRRILELRYREDFSLNEIAEILGEPYNTIKSRHGRAIRSLRKAFSSDQASELPTESYS